MGERKRCAVCGSTLAGPGETFIVDIRGYASPEVPDLSADELEKDLEETMNRLLERVQHAGPEELEEMEAEVYFSCSFVLCRECYRRYIAHPVPNRWELYPEEESWE